MSGVKIAGKHILVEVLMCSGQVVSTTRPPFLMKAISGSAEKGCHETCCRLAWREQITNLLLLLLRSVQAEERLLRRWVPSSTR